MKERDEAEMSMLEQAAQSAGLTFRRGGADDEHYAVVMWRSTGPVMAGANHNRVMICDSPAMTAVVIDLARLDLESAKLDPGYFQA